MPKSYRWHARVRLFKLPQDECRHDTDPILVDGHGTLPAYVARTLDGVIEFVMQTIDLAHLPPAIIDGIGAAAAVRLNNAIRNALHRDGTGRVVTRLAYHVTIPDTLTLTDGHLGEAGHWRALVELSRV